MSSNALIMPQPIQAAHQPALLPTIGMTDIAVFWDYENIQIPRWCSATVATEAIRNKLHQYGRVVEKRLYYDSQRPQYNETVPRSDLDLSGFTLVDCPSRGRKESLDKKLIVDALCFAWERASMGAKACVVLITSDGDYSYTLARLRDIGIFTIIFYSPNVVAQCLIDNANVAYKWESDVLGRKATCQGDECFHEAHDGYNYGRNPIISPNNGANECLESNGNSLALTTKSTLGLGSNENVKSQLDLFCSVILNAQKSMKSTWIDDSHAADAFYKRIGEKKAKVFQEIRTLAYSNGFIERGRRHAKKSGQPVCKMSDRDLKTNKKSGMHITCLRLTSAGVSAVNVKPKTDDVSKKTDLVEMHPILSPIPSQADAPIHTCILL